MSKPSPATRLCFHTTCRNFFPFLRKLFLPHPPHKPSLRPPQAAQPQPGQDQRAATAPSCPGLLKITPALNNSTSFGLISEWPQGLLPAALQLLEQEPFIAGMGSQGPSWGWGGGGSQREGHHLQGHNIFVWPALLPVTNTTPAQGGKSPLSTPLLSGKSPKRSLESAYGSNSKWFHHFKSTIPPTSSLPEGECTKKKKKKISPNKSKSSTFPLFSGHILGLTAKPRTKRTMEEKGLCWVIHFYFLIGTILK